MESLKKNNQDIDNNLIQNFNNEKEISLVNDNELIQDVNDYTNAPKLKKN